MNKFHLVINLKEGSLDWVKSLTNDLSLSNVLFVDSCSYNLLSIAQFCDLGLSCTFDDEGVTITKKKTVGAECGPDTNQ
jgi:hypothetical protein